MSCQVCLSTLKAGDLYCSSCGAVVPEHPIKPQVADVQGRIAGERKYLTVLCADLQRSTDLIAELDPEAAISRLEPALIAMRTAVRRNRGIVSKEGGDGLIALFGAPHADDNHAVMACHAAVELVRRVKLLDDPGTAGPGRRSFRLCRRPCHRGRLLPRSMKPAARRSIWSSGSRARAQAGQILVSESCQNLAAGLVTFNALAPKRLEGFAAPVPCYELVEISGLHPLAGPFDQGAFVVRRTRRGDCPARAGGAGCRIDRADHRAGRHRGHRQIPTWRTSSSARCGSRTGRCWKRTAIRWSRPFPMRC